MTDREKDVATGGRHTEDGESPTRGAAPRTPPACCGGARCPCGDSCDCPPGCTCQG